jgi:2-amino-4-hydroxy-6-hydroxymethyldihydropteridine diphosphokinase
MSIEVYFGLGSNLGDRAMLIEQAVGLIARMPVTDVLARSALIETPAEGGAAQPPYLNGVIKTRTGLAAPVLHDLTLAIEKQMGRKGKGDGAPRLIDIDILLFGNEILESPKLKIPHPRMLNRLFVMRPLAELAPELEFPGSGLTVTELLRELEGRERNN